MRLRSFRFLTALVFALGACAAALAFVAGSNAGSTGATLKLFAHPQALRVNGTGFVKAAYTAASGAGTGSATHVVITVTLPTGLVFDAADSSVGCSIADPANHPNDVVCSVGTVNGGATATRFVTFQATTAGAYTVTGSATQDNGTGGNGGGGGSVNTPISANPVGQFTVYASTDSSHDGNCFFKGGTVQTPTPTASDNQSTGANVGTLSSSAGIPCAFADVGEDPAPPGSGFDTAISHDNIASGLIGPATITLSLYSMPTGVPFSTFSWLFSPDYPASLPSQSIPLCENGKLPMNAIVCLLSKKKMGNGGTWTFLQLGTGSDPAFGH
jgi:Domain of unknown function DUF11